MSRQLGDVRYIWRIFDQIIVSISIVYVITNSEELLSVVVRAGQQDSGNAYNIRLRELGDIWNLTLISKLIN